jgi:hypothetical protein
VVKESPLPADAARHKPVRGAAGLVAQSRC